MPKEARERQDNFTEWHSLLDICLMVHQYSCGTSDEFLPEKYEYHKETLAIALNHWEESIPQCQKFDDAVKNLIYATLDEALTAEG
jgi:hypothetical protein